MAVDMKRRQKKLMKKRQKDKMRKRKQAESVPFSLLSAANKIHQARNFPIYECLINPDWREKGLVTILISRQQPDGMVLFGVYLVDIYCLGVKNTFCNADFSMLEYNTKVRGGAFGGQDYEKCSLALAHHIIYGSIEYAAQFGFRPNKDFKLSQYVLEEDGSFEPCEDVEFGLNGKPFYITGPDDNVDRIMRQLELTAGKGNFDFVSGGLR